MTAAAFGAVVADDDVVVDVAVDVAVAVVVAVVVTQAPQE